ncbi:MAG TPA: hypothetical protein VJR05_10820 [Acidimicrobiia bacterium]|nr:hypothetical protein [Acidimicrobiia bacterium]
MATSADRAALPPRAREQPSDDALVDLVGEDSFPASDPPPFWAHGRPSPPRRQPQGPPDRENLRQPRIT